MRNWEPQELPGILEGLPPMPVRMPSEALSAVTEALSQLKNVDVPDWLDSDPTNDELYALAITLDTWDIITSMIRGQLVRKAFIR